MGLPDLRQHLDLKRRFSTLKYKATMAILIMICIIYSSIFFNNKYVSNTVYEQIANSNSNFLQLYMENMESMLVNSYVYLNNFAYKNVPLNNLAYGSRTATDDAISILVNSLYADLYEGLLFYNWLDGFFCYDIGRDALHINLSNERIERDERNNVSDFLVNYLSEENHVEQFVRQWTILNINDSAYLFRGIQMKDVIIGTWLSFDMLMSDFELFNQYENGYVFMVDPGTNLLTSRDIDTIHDITVDLTDTGDYYLSSEYLVVQCKSSMSDFWLVFAAYDSEILHQFPYLNYMIFLLVVIAALVLIIILVLFSRSVLVPIHIMVDAMKKVKDGFMDVQIKNLSKTTDFNIMYKTFNDMISQIHSLKINVYEEQLAKEREEFERLQLQIKPHFFLNSLNIIYELTKVKDYQKIQEITQSMMEYFRYAFRDSAQMVHLEDEIKHVMNYLLMQQLRFDDNLSYEVNYNPITAKIYIPPFIIQTFVENSIKHGMQSGIHTHIRLDVWQSDDHLTVIIHDNGNGFPEEVLEPLNNGEKISDPQGNHIGIYNVIRRLHLAFDKQAQVAFYNDNEGAIVEIDIDLSEGCF